MAVQQCPSCGEWIDDMATELCPTCGEAIDPESVSR